MNLEHDLIALLAKYKNIYKNFAERITTDLFNDILHKEIVSDIIVNANDKNYDYYSLMIKYGDNLPHLDLEIEDKIEYAENLINRLTFKSAQARLNQYCSAYTKSYMSNNNPSIDKFFEYIKNLNTNIDDIKIYDSSHLLETLNQKHDVVFKLNTMIGDFRKGVVIIAGRPGMAKTTLAVNMFIEQIQNNTRSVFFSLEMPVAQINELIKCAVMDKSLNSVISPDMLNRFENFISFAKNNMFVIDKESLTTSSIEKSINRIIVQNGKVDFVIIDNLNLINKNNEREYDALSRITAELKSLSKRLDIVLLVIAHVNRENSARSDKKPILSDLRGSGTIEQDADYVVFIHREDYYYLEKGQIPPHEIKNVLEFWHAKNRFEYQQSGYKHINLANKKVKRDLTDFEIQKYKNILLTKQISKNSF